MSKQTTESTAGDSLLTFASLTVSFGGLLALDSASGSIRRNGITAVIGPNGAGKTTLLNTATGFLQPDSGELTFDNRDITGLPPHEVARLGINRTFQDLRLFAGLSVFDNIMASFPNQIGENPARLFTEWRRVNSQERAYRVRASEILEFVGLEHKRLVPAEDLSYGQQKRLALGRALANDAALLMLDEPAAGLDPQGVQEMAVLLNTMVTELDKTVCLIEHNLAMVKELASWVIGMGRGQVVVEGPAETVFTNEQLVASYITGG